MTESGRAGSRRRPGNAFLAFLAASIAAHAAVFGSLPALTRGTDPAPTAVLRVVILAPLPLLVAPTEPVAHPRSSVRSDPRRSPAAVEPGPDADPSGLAPAMPEPSSNERRPTATGVEAPESAAAPSPGQATQAPAVAAAPASVSAAYLNNPAPRYPDAARRSGEQGTVTLRVQVARDGAASRVAVEKSSGSPHLDAAALEAVKAWRFTPARRGGEAVESWMLVPIVFRLDGVS
jgi:protein TonB